MTEFLSIGRVAKPTNPMYEGGKCLRTVQAAFSKLTAAQTDGDIYVLAEGLSGDTRVHAIRNNKQIAAAALAINNDIGFYKRTLDGTLVAVDADILVDGFTLGSAIGVGDLLDQNASLDRTKNINELLSYGTEDEPVGGFVLAMTVNTKSSGTIAFNVDIELETANTN